jgi:pyruvate/2-oxoglutarate dehydrogenase complex dihydrolipoamide dehydrogenase (E3) component
VSDFQKHSWDFDVAVIGGGSAGYAAARTAAGLGLNTVVIEGGEQVGGLCILRGCMPTKALLYAAEVMHLTANANVWGIHPGKPGFDFKKVMARKNVLIDDFASYRQKQLETGKFKFVRSNARFIDPHTVELFSGGELTAAGFIIATGSVIAHPAIPGLEEVGCLDSDSALELERLPDSLIILGGGSVALEFAQFFARFGVKVTLIQRSPHVLHSFDTDSAEVIESVFRRENIELYTHTHLVCLRRKSGKKEVQFEHEGRTMTVCADELFLALGRQPNVASLGLDTLGVALDDGRIITDAAMRTNIPHIFAAGDCTGPYEIVHLAVQQGEIAGHNAGRPQQPKEMDYRLLTEIVFTDPQLAFVGLTEREASSRKIPFIAASYPFNDHGKSLIMEAKDGFVKLLADPKTGEIIGGACAGPMGGELIHEIIVAMSKHVTVQELAAMPHYHPTLAEIWTYPAEELAAKLR